MIKDSDNVKLLEPGKTPAKRRFPNTVDEPRNIGYYLKPLLDITKRPDRDEILKTYLKETYV